MALWDFLRPLSMAAANFDSITRVIVFVFSFALFAIALIAYSRSKSKRFLLVAMAFLFFTIKWLLKVLDIFVSPGNFFPDTSENIFELLIFVALFIAIFKK